MPQIAREDTAPDVEQNGEVVVLMIGSNVYAVRATDVREVIPLPEITPLPTSASVFLGLCNVRGDVIPILDMSALLGLGAGPAATHAVVVRVAEGEAGLSTTNVPSFSTLGERVGEASVPGQVGAYRCADAIVTLLDLDALVTRRRLDAE